MTPIQFATLLIRAFSALMFVLAAAALTEIAYGSFLVLISVSNQSEEQRDALLVTYVIRFVMYFGVAIVSGFFSKPLAKFITKDLV
jgi:hypothetical protein